MNLRTLGRLFILGNLILLGFLANFFAVTFSLPPALGPCLILVGLVGVIGGAISGLLLFKGKIPPKCPQCDSVVEFHGGQSIGNLRQTLYADCPRCGCLEFSFRQLSGIKIERVTPHGMETQYDEELDHDEDEVETSEPKRPFFQRHAMGLVLFLCPVVASVTWASLHHRFNFFYLFIPGVWCSAMAIMLLSTWESGYITWKNGGITLRSKNPVRFWSTSFVCLCFYALVLCFPIGYAKQELAKEEKTQTTPTSPPPAKR